MKYVPGVLIGMTAAASLAAQSPPAAASENWPRDASAFVRLLMGEDLGLRPSPGGIASFEVPDSVRQKVIGAQVIWTIFRRPNPLGSGPTTLPAIGITQGDQTTGVLVAMARRAPGDTEVCATPYQDVAIDAKVHLTGKVSSFLAGIRPDGNRVIVVELVDVPGCQGGAPTPVDLTGRWTHERRGGRTKGRPTGTLDLAREASCDQDGFTCFKGSNRYEPDGESKQDTTSAQKPQDWAVAVKGARALVIMGNALTSCVGTVSALDKIVAECSLLQISIGTLTLIRSKTTP